MGGTRSDRDAVVEELRRPIPVVELRIDSVVKTLSYTRRDGADPVCGIYWHNVDEGQEVGPWGALMEYQDWEVAPNPKIAESNRPARVAYRRRRNYPSIFLNYRRDDAEAYAGRLHETLVRAFGSDAVFMDQFSIDPGEHFAWTIQQAVAHARVVLALIGPRWDTAVDDQGRSRFSSEHDFVRRELTAALDRGTRIVPILLPNTEVGVLSRVPWDHMYTLGELRAISVTARHWTVATDDLIGIIRPILEDG
jgi:hypothetical protein